MGHISFVGKLDGVTLSAGAPAFAPGFTLEQMAKHSLDFWLTSEDLPDPDNRVTLDRDGQHRARLHAEQRAGHSSCARLRRAVKQRAARRTATCHDDLFARSLFVGQRIPLAGVAHQNGTIRFGHDPTDLGARRALQGPRRRQPLRRRRQLLPVERGGESGADDRRQRACASAITCSIASARSATRRRWPCVRA